MSERAQALAAIREHLRNFETVKRTMDRIGNTTTTLERYVADVTTLLGLVAAPPVGVSPQPDECRESLAALAHEQWTGWMRHLWRQCEYRESPDGPLMVIPAVWARRWERQMDTPFDKLSQREQDSDRKEADRVLALLASLAPVEPTPPAEDEDDDEVPAARAEGAPDAWSAPLRKPVVPKILSTDDFYALLRILEVLPADPFLSALQSKLSDEERRQHGNQASHLSGPEFVREIERVEALIQSRVQLPALPVEPTPRCVCPDCEPLVDPVPQPSEDDINRLEKAAWDSHTDLVLVWYRDQIRMYQQRLRETERAWQVERKSRQLAPVEPTDFPS